MTLTIQPQRLLLRLAFAIALSRPLASDKAEPSCLPFAKTTVTRHKPTTLYGIPVQACTAEAVVTLADCSEWKSDSRELPCDLNGTIARINDTDSEACGFSYTANQTSETYQATRQLLATQTGIPKWFRDTVILPYYDKFLGPQAMSLARRINGSSEVRPLKSTVDVIFIDLLTLRQVPVNTACWSLAERVPYFLAIHHYWSFYGYAGFGLRNQVDALFEPLFGSLALDRAQSASVLLSAYCAPFDILLLVFALSVVRKALDESDSHIYHYHKALAIADIMIVLLMFAKETIVTAYIAVPFCLGWPHAFKAAIESKSWQYRVQPRIADFAAIPIVTLVSFSYIIQSLLAADRFTALFLPLSYYKLKSVRKVKQFIGLAAGLTFVVLLAGLTSSPVLQCALVNPDVDSCWQDCTLCSSFSYGKIPGWLLNFTACVVQVMCCSALFVKMLLRFRKPEHRAESMSRRMVPFCLLVGTSGVGLLGLAFEATMAIFGEFLNADTSGGNTGRLSGLFAGMKFRLRISVLSGCSSWGVLLHLLVSSHCRAAAKEQLENALKLLRKSRTSVGSLLSTISRTIKPNEAVDAAH